MYLGVGAAYWLDLRGYDPAEALLRVAAPALIMNGGRDYQAPPTELGQWRRKLGKRDRTEIVELSALDHLLVAGEGPSDPKDYPLARHVDVAAIDLIAGWVLRR